MVYLLFIAWLSLFCWLISRLKFFSNLGISTRLLIFLFLLRVAISLISCYFNLYYYPVSDTLYFHREGLVEYNLLMDNPREYFSNLFRDPYANGYSRFLDASQSFWNDTRSYLIIKLLSVFDLFSMKNFFINTLFYNFLVFFGVTALYKLFIKIFPASSLQLIACIFILPSALFFSSMIHRDGLILLSLSMVLYQVNFMLKQNRISWKRILATLIFLLLILLLRSFVFITLIPALLAWIVAEKKPRKTFLVFIGVYGIVAVLFFCSGLISSKTDLPRYVSERQIAFIEIAKEGASTININPLFPNFRSFLNNAPQGLNHSLFRPYLTEIYSFVYIPFALEIVFFEILFLLFIFFRRKADIIHPLIYFCVFFSLSMFLVIGYTVPIIGAFVRYRSIYFIFLMIPIFCYIDWLKVGDLLRIKNNKI